MKRVLCTLAIMMIATAAFAGQELTPQQAWDKMVNCPVCSAWNQDPALGPTLRYDISQTKNGFVEIFQTNNDAMKPAFDKAEAECERRVATIPTMSAADKAKLCPFCTAHVTLSQHKDVSVENAPTSMGFASVGWATSPDGIKALHDYAAACKKQSDLIQQASMEMQKQGAVQKAKM